jgi:hypothetical protein
MVGFHHAKVGVRVHDAVGGHRLLLSFRVASPPSAIDAILEWALGGDGRSGCQDEGVEQFIGQSAGAVR